jgi:hypothetical protein
MAENLDPNIINELNQRFSELTNTSNSLGSSFTTTKTQSDKLGEAFDKLTKQVNRLSKDDKEVTEKSIDAEKKATEALEKRTRAEEDNTKVVQENTKATGDTAKRILSAGSSVDGALNLMQDRLTDIAGGGPKVVLAMQAMRIAVDGVVTVLKAAYDAQVAYTKSILAGERGQAVVAKQAEAVGKAFNSVIDQVGNFAIGLGAVMAIMGGPLGIAFGGLTAILGVGAKAYAKASDTALEFATQIAGLKDKLFQGFNELGKASMIGAGGMTELQRQLNELGLTMAEVSEFTGLVKGAGKELKLLGASTSEGLKSFVKTAGTLIKSDLGRTLETMGITAADQRESMISFMTTEARLGKARITDQEKLNKAAFNYIIEMDKLAELTGATRKEQEEARNQILAIEELRAAMLDEQDAAEKEKLERALKNAESLYAAGAKGMAAGVAKYFAAGEAMTSPEAVKTFQSAPQLLDRISKGQGTVAENMVLAATEMKDQAKQFASVGRLNAEAVKGIMAEGFGTSSDLFLRLKDAPEQAKKMGLSLDDYLKQQREVVDKQTITQVDLVRSQREDAIRNEHSAGTLSHASGQFSEAVDKFGEITGAYGKTFGATAGAIVTDPKKVLEQQKQRDPKLVEQEAKIMKHADMVDKASIYVMKGIEGATSLLGKGLSAVGLEGAGSRVQAVAGAAKEERIASGMAEVRKREGDPLAGLNFGGRREERTGGGEADPNLIAMAHKINETFPGVVITSLNDKFHQEKRKTSKHTIGKALDFAMNPPPKDAREAEEIRQQLMGMGANKVLDEYFAHKTAKTTGGHFHVEIAHNGGYFKSSLGDFPVLLKNDEYVLTNQMVENLKSKLEDNVTKSPIESVFPEATSPATSTKNTEIGDMITMFIQSQEVVSEKLDTMIEVLESGLSLQDKLVKYART